MTIEELSTQMNNRFDEVDKRLNDIDEKMENTSSGLFVIEKKVDTLNNKLDIIIKLNQLRASSTI